MKQVSINKKVVAIVAIIALIAILGICLVACNNQKDFEKRLKDKNYIVTSMSADQLKDIVGDDVDEVEWAVIGMKGNGLTEEGEYVMIIKCKSEGLAKDCEAELNTEELQESEAFKFVRKGKLIILGTTKAVDDAQ